jgi:hypothetical protein
MWQVPVVLSGARSIGQVWVNGKSVAVKAGTQVAVPAFALAPGGSAVVIGVYE